MNNHKILFTHYIKYKNKKGGLRNKDGIEVSTINEDMVLTIASAQKSGRISNEIAKKVNTLYLKFHKKLIISGTKNPSFTFSIKNIENVKNKENTWPIWNQGNSNAVYEISDFKEVIGEDNPNLLLKLSPQPFQLNSETSEVETLDQMMNFPKIKYEYGEYGEYLPRIYFYGILYKDNESYVPPTFFSKINSFVFRSNDIPKYIPITVEGVGGVNINYVITKKYNSLPELQSEFNVKYSRISNLQKIRFIISNINMLNRLYNNNSFHGDYKPANVGWENDITMNVILLDYEVKTIVDVTDKSNFDNFYDFIKPNFPYTLAYAPKYAFSGVQSKITKQSEYVKWSIGGLAALIMYLDIQYNTSDVINFPPTISNLTLDPNIKNEGDAITSNFLNLYSKTYDEVPSYDELGRIFKYIIDNQLFS